MSEGERQSARERLPAILGQGRGALSKRILGMPLLFAVGYAAVGFSLYFSIGLVADRGLGLTPVVFLAAGVLFVLATLTYVEGGAMFPERGGSSMLARHAFNELVSFIAGWAILIEYVIVIALASISFAQYLSPVWGGFNHGAGSSWRSAWSSSRRRRSTSRGHSAGRRWCSRWPSPTSRCSSR